MAMVAKDNRTMASVPWSNIAGWMMNDVIAPRPAMQSTTANRNRFMETLPNRLFNASRGLPARDAVETVEISVRETMPPRNNMPAKPRPMPVCRASRSTRRAVRAPTTRMTAAPSAKTTRLPPGPRLPRSSSSDNEAVPAAVVLAAASAPGQAQSDQRDADDQAEPGAEARAALEQERRRRDPGTQWHVQEAHCARDFGHGRYGDHDDEAADDVIAEIQRGLVADE